MWDYTSPDIPERGQRCATEATERLRASAGNTIRLEDGPRLTGTYGWVLAYVDAGTISKYWIWDPSAETSQA